MRNNIYKTGFFFVLVCLFIGLCTMPGQAATEDEKQAAIDTGLVYLAQNQEADGRWEYGDTGSDIGCTGAALLAFLEEGYQAGTNVVINGIDYGDVVGEGLNYLFSMAQPYTISAEPAGDPDSDGNGIGVKFNYTAGDQGRDTYATGLAIPAIAATGTPNALVTVGALVGRTDGSGAGGAWTYGDVVQNAIDYFAYGQADAGWARGGWRYYADYGQADNSTSQWPVVSILFSSIMGSNVPAFVETELDYWISFIQNPGDGGSYYDNWFAGWGSNMSRTGTLVMQMGFSDWPNEPGIAHTNFGNNQAAYFAALNYINTGWKTIVNGTWNGNFGHPYAMWAVYKGLEFTIGLDDLVYITNLNDQSAYRGGAGAPLDPGDDWTWWEDYCEHLVNTQNPNGSWTGYSFWTGSLATAWNINILAATQIPSAIAVNVDIKPQSCPNPFNPEAKGVLPVAILGTDEFDVTTIDPTTILIRRDLEDNSAAVSPLRWSFEDVATPFEGEECECWTEGADGFMDLTIKFENQEIATVLGNFEDGDEFPLYITGYLFEEFSGTAIEGSDCIIIRAKGNKTGKLAADGAVAAIPDAFKLYPVFPNPFNPSTTIRYTLPQESIVEISIYNTVGQKTATLVNTYQPAGEYHVQWKPNTLPSGLYIISFKAGNYHKTEKVLYMK